MSNRLRRKRAVVSVAVVAVLGLTAAAFAYFTSTGSGTGSAGVGYATPWGVQLGSPSFSGGLSAIYPGNGTETIPYTVTNNGSGDQKLNTLAIAVDLYNGGPDAADATGNDIPGCLASWFNASVDNPAPAVDLAPSHAFTGDVTLTMSDSQTNQDACKNASPGLTLYADQSAPVYYNAPAGPNEYTSSGVTLAAGERAVVTASGQWTNCPTCDQQGPDGVAGTNWGVLDPDANALSLVGSLNGGASWFSLGSGPTTITGPGTLLLAMNDSAGGWGDNSGALRVTIQRITSG
jgi:hypothetical protein